MYGYMCMLYSYDFNALVSNMPLNLRVDGSSFNPVTYVFIIP